MSLETKEKFKQRYDMSPLIRIPNLIISLTIVVVDTLAPIGEMTPRKEEKKEKAIMDTKVEILVDRDGEILRYPLVGYMHLIINLLATRTLFPFITSLFRKEIIIKE